MLELQDSLSTENSDDDSSTNNRAYVPCGVGVTVQVVDVCALGLFGKCPGDGLHASSP